MLIDFSDVKSILMEHIHDVVDHAFLVYDGDIELLKSLSQLEDQKIVSLPFIPTAENLAKWAYYIVEPHLKTTYGNDLRLRSFNVRRRPTGHPMSRRIGNVNQNSVAASTKVSSIGSLAAIG